MVSISSSNSSASTAISASTLADYLTFLVLCKKTDYRVGSDARFLNNLNLLKNYIK
jgi:hypothetical protein